MFSGTFLMSDSSRAEPTALISNGDHHSTRANHARGGCWGWGRGEEEKSGLGFVSRFGSITVIHQYELGLGRRTDQSTPEQADQIMQASFPGLGRQHPSRLVGIQEIG